MQSEQEQIKILLMETIGSICRNGLSFNKQLRVQGLLGITLDDQNVFIVQIDENVSVPPISKEPIKNSIIFDQSNLNDSLTDEMISNSYNSIIINDDHTKNMDIIYNNEANKYIPLKIEPDNSTYYSECEIVESNNLCSQSDCTKSNSINISSIKRLKDKNHKSQAEKTATKIKKVSEGLSTIGYLKMEPESSINSEENIDDLTNYYLPSINVQYEVMNDVFNIDGASLKIEKKNTLFINSKRKSRNNHIRMPRRPRESAEKSFVCLHCGLSYYFKKHLKFHLYKKHAVL